MNRAHQAVLLSFLILSTSPAAGSPMLRTVALTGQQAPGLPSGVAFDGFYHPVVNSGGNVAFSADLSGNGVNATNDSGLWSEGFGPVAKVAREGDYAPGTPVDVSFGKFSRLVPSFADSGLAAFVTDWKAPDAPAPGENRMGIWEAKRETLDLLVRTGDYAPGTPVGAEFLFLGEPQINSSGQVLFTGIADGVGTESAYRLGIWTGNSDAITTVALTGQQAPGLPAGVEYNAFYGYAHSINSAGEVSFRADLRGVDIDGFNNDTLWIGHFDAVAPVVREGGETPGLADDVAIVGGMSDSAQINSTGQRVVTALLKGGHIDEPVWYGIGRADSQSFELIAQTGDHPAGTDEGVEFDRHFSATSKPDLSGQIAFGANLRGPDVNDTNDWGIWTGDHDSLELLARLGDRPPGVQEEWMYGSFYSPILNEYGQAAFAAQLADEDGKRIREYGIWAQDRSGILELIARTGDVLEVAPGDTRTIDEVYFFNGTPINGGIPTATGFNDLGQVAFWATFTDGSEGIFVSNVVANPEPSSIVLFAAGVAGVVGIVTARRKVSPTGSSMMIGPSRSRKLPITAGKKAKAGAESFLTSCPPAKGSPPAIDGQCQSGTRHCHTPEAYGFGGTDWSRAK